MHFPLAAIALDLLYLLKDLPYRGGGDTGGTLKQGLGLPASTLTVEQDAEVFV